MDLIIKDYDHLKIHISIIFYLIINYIILNNYNTATNMIATNT